MVSCAARHQAHHPGDDGREDEKHQAGNDLGGLKPGSCRQFHGHEGIFDDPDDQSKQGFIKNLIGSSPMDGMGGGDHHPSKDIPALVWALPIVGFIGVGIAVAAYCSFGT